MTSYKILWAMYLMLLPSAIFGQNIDDRHPDMVFVKGGTFQMGCTPEQAGECSEYAKPVHTVTVSSFYIGKYEITNEQYAKFLNEYGAKVVKAGDFKGQKMVMEFKWGVYLDGDVWKPQKGYEQHPIGGITWFGANKYCQFYGGHLPTEAEWEYAARGGNKSKGYKYAGSDKLVEVAWCVRNSEDIPHPVG